MPRALVIAIHIGYWIVFTLLLLLFYFFLSILPDANSKNEVHPGYFPFFLKLMIGFAIVPAIICFYGFYSWLFPYYLAKKKYVVFGIWAIGLSVLASFVGIGIEVLPITLGTKFLATPSFQGITILVSIMSFNGFINGIIGMVIKGFISWVNESKATDTLKQRNLEVELQLIKSKIDPHFLFNTINNIDVLVEKDAVAASNYLRQLSDIMRFMLYETQDVLIPLVKDIDYIDKYLSLQRIRYAYPNYVVFEVLGEPSNRMVAPMLFMPFIENAFKHAKKAIQETAIHISLNMQPSYIQFICENRRGEVLLEESNVGGLGAQLIAKRIQLLYPTQHKLSIVEEKEIYRVDLILWI